MFCWVSDLQLGTLKIFSQLSFNIKKKLYILGDLLITNSEALSSLVPYYIFTLFQGFAMLKTEAIANIFQLDPYNN